MKNTVCGHFSSGFYCCNRIVKPSYRTVLAIIFMALWSYNISAQNAIDYDAVVQKGKSQLQEGLADMALASGERAIKLRANRWEGYALAGGALMNLKRYEEAADKLSEAIQRAPEKKQIGLRDLRRQCLLIESGTTPKDAPPATTTQPEIVMWKSIENSTNPDDFMAYLKQYPNGAFATLAEDRREKAVKAREDVAAAQAESRRQAGTDSKVCRFKHIWAGDTGCVSDGVFNIHPGGIAYKTSSNDGFAASCSEIKSVGLYTRYGTRDALELNVPTGTFYFRVISLKGEDLLDAIRQQCSK